MRIWRKLRLVGRPFRRGDGPRVYLLPNLMTAGNLFCGFLAVVRIFEGMRWDDSPGGHIFYYQAIALILGACVFDLLDGLFARRSGQESAFGREFDSLADIVSFGIAPALLVMDIVLEDFSGRLGWFVAFIYLLCGGMRLARFNVMSIENPKNGATRDFRGVPIPAAAGVIASLTLLLLWLNENDGRSELGNWRYLLVALMILLSFLMLSDIRYPSFKGIHFSTKRTIPMTFLVFIVLLLAILYWQWMPAVLFGLYLSYGLVRPWVSRKWRREIEQEDVEAMREGTGDNSALDEG
ncbi:MAG: CDP-diacylglycerol--serine O-phosphatidyltransferase [Verrucomicrobiota bacterium]